MAEVMPTSMHPHDAKWINEQLRMCYDYNERIKVCAAYSKVHSEAYDAEPDENLKDSKARRKANMRLLEYMEKKSRVFNK
jgi:hypothetical protein